MKKRFFLIFFFILGLFHSNSQEYFELDDGLRSSTLNFKTSQNLIIIPVTINNVELSFLLDTGASQTILFNMKDADMFRDKLARVIYFKGLTGEEKVKAYKVKHNKVSIGKATHKDLDLYLIEDTQVNFFPKLGIKIHGIVGGDFFKSFRCSVNYISKRLKFESFDKPLKGKVNKKYEAIDLNIISLKPYIDVGIETHNSNSTIQLLIDTGMSDAIWLLESEKVIKPNKRYQDYLGRSISGHVFGERGKLSTLKVKSFEFEDVVSGFPDSSSTAIPNNKEKRYGTIGSELLKRFNFIIDYDSKKIYLKKNRYFNSPFFYNISGLELHYDGFTLVEKVKRVSQSFTLSENKGAVFENKVASKVSIDIEPTIRILSVREKSAAEEVGLKKGDVLLKINNTRAIGLDISEISQKLFENKGKEVQIVIDRDGIIKKYAFVLEDRL